MDSYLKKVFVFFVFCSIFVTFAMARPDSAGHPPEGFAYGGIPYGSMSGNVAEYYRMKQAETAFHNVVSPVHYAPRPVVHYPNYYSLYH